MWLSRAKTFLDDKRLTSDIQTYVLLFIIQIINQLFELFKKRSFSWLRFSKRRDIRPKVSKAIMVPSFRFLQIEIKWLDELQAPTLNFWVLWKISNQHKEFLS